jgi:catechol 2,3-dioxygenase-like lactoylglutathione lyase family enzyme
MVKFQDSATVLEVKDVAVSEAFYREKLGFSPGRFYGEPPNFCLMSRDRVRVYLDRTRSSPRATPLNQYWSLYIYVDDVDAFAAELAARGLSFAREIEDQDYGCRDFDIRDPDGHLIGIGQTLTKG